MAGTVNNEEEHPYADKTECAGHEVDPAVVTIVDQGGRNSRANGSSQPRWLYPPVSNANRFSQDVTIGPALFGWIATLKFYQKIGIRSVEQRVRRLGGYAIERLLDIGCTITSPTDPAKRHGLITYATGDYEKDRAFFQRCAAPGRCMKPIKISMRALGESATCVSAPTFSTRKKTSTTSWTCKPGCFMWQALQLVRCHSNLQQICANRHQGNHA
jgi:GNAT superfamily N-acetyltransferase